MNADQIAAVVTASVQPIVNALNNRQRGGDVDEQRHKREQNIRRTATSAPIYKSGDNFPEWKISMESWRLASGILDTYTVTLADGSQETRFWHEAEFQAQQLLLQFRGSAAARVKSIGPGTAAWNRTIGLGAEPNHNVRFDSYLVEVENLFLPPAESVMARQQFLGRKQKATEDISTYLQDKFTFYRQAYSEAARATQGDFLRDEVIKGCFNHVIRRRLLESQPVGEADIRTAAISAVAIERQKFSMNCAESVNLDGLAASSKGSYTQGAEMMDVNSINAFRKAEPTDICNRCHKAGHFAYQCRQPWEKVVSSKARGSANQLKLKDRKPANPDAKIKCRYCRNLGHKEADCRKKKAAMKEKESGRSGAGGQRGRAGRGGQRGRKARPGGGVREVRDGDGDDDDYTQDDGDDYDDDPFLGQGQGED